MLNVVSIDPKSTAKQSVVEMAKTILAAAEAGELVDLSWFASSPDGSVNTGFTATDDQLRRIAAASRLLWRLQQTFDDGV